ncbi:hypothetical protein GT348_00855 [Aristophania vespae]|uniref:ABC-type transport auxiliary lipoprotein component domain-containing protein n=1 Tax=Aristophania vespae TaxID=2697033 RepID=A0A6P1NJL1_9PROT|nr:hypothetical protein GT348_00855 [Aristophania vespae]
MLTQTLVSDIAQRLPNRVVFAQNQFVALEPTDFVDLAVQNFEQDENGYAVINGVISVEQKRSPQNSATSLPFHWVSPQPVSADPQALVAALSEGVGVIADQAVNLLQQ